MKFDIPLEGGKRHLELAQKTLYRHRCVGMQ